MTGSMVWPMPFSGITSFYAFERAAGLERFIRAALQGCPHVEGKGTAIDGGPVLHDHNFAVDTGHRRIFGSDLLMECVTSFVVQHLADYDLHPFMPDHPLSTTGCYFCGQDKVHPLHRGMTDVFPDGVRE